MNLPSHNSLLVSELLKIFYTETSKGSECAVSGRAGTKGFLGTGGLAESTTEQGYFLPSPRFCYTLESKVPDRAPAHAAPLCTCVQNCFLTEVSLFAGVFSLTRILTPQADWPSLVIWPLRIPRGNRASCSWRSVSSGERAFTSLSKE